MNLILAHQYTEQLPEALQAAVLGNVGTIIAFRIGARDARFLAPEFAPVFGERDLTCLPKHHIAIKLMIDGVSSEPFSAVTLGPRTLPNNAMTHTIQHTDS